MRKDRTTKTTHLVHSFFNLCPKDSSRFLAFALLQYDAVENYEQGSWDEIILQRIFHI